MRCHSRPDCFSKRHAAHGIPVYIMGTTDERNTSVCALKRLALQAVYESARQGYTQCSVVPADLYALEQTLHAAFSNVCVFPTVVAAPE